MENISELLNARLRSAVDIINNESLTKLQLMPKSIKVDVSFMVVPMQKGYAFVVIGTKENPAGITNTEADYVVFLGKDLEDKNYIYNMLTVDSVKNLIKNKYTSLKKGIDENYEHMGVYILDDDLLPF